jgi:predicted HD superfamily hydrolase involved in NAD metabolism
MNRDGMNEENLRPSAEHVTPPGMAYAEAPCDDPLVAPYCHLVRQQVTPERLQHILRVAQTALAIGKSNGFSREELDEVALASVLHDAARDMSDAQLMRLAPPECELEAEHPIVLHGRAARVLAVRWGVTDQVVLEAVEGHVFGVPDGHAVGMSVYVADVCEPGRGVNDDLRELAMLDLGAAYRQAVAAKVEYLRRTGKPVHHATLAAYHSFASAGSAHDA